VKVGLRGQAEAIVGVIMPEYIWPTAWYMKLLRLQQAIIRYCVRMCKQTRVREGITAHCTVVMPIVELRLAVSDWYVTCHQSKFHTYPW
jgi:hypothetical protein